MKHTPIMNMQIGKNGITENFIIALKNTFITHNNVKISVLKSATRGRGEMQKIAQQICAALGIKFTCKIVGFTIFIKQWRKVPLSNRK